MSLLESYKSSGLLFNSNFLEQTQSAGTFGYRGELVLVEGEVADAKGHVKPPTEVMRGVAILADAKIQMIIGAIDQLASAQTFIDKYQSDFADNVQVLLFVVDIKDPVKVTLNGVNFVFLPLVQGVPWNEMLDELALEKSDFKGQSAADKILTLYDEMKSYQPKYPEVDFSEALGATTGQVREGWGAV